MTLANENREGRPNAARATRHLPAAIAAAILLAISWPHLTHLRLAFDSNWINDDARGWLAALYVWPLPDATAPDPQIDYYRAITPIGFSAIYDATRPLVDPLTLSRWLPYALLATCLWALARAAHALAGWPGAAGALAFALSSPSLLARMTGGLPRSFAFPLLALGLLALVRARPVALALAALAGALLYPSAGLTLGLALAIWLLVVPERHRGTSWSLPRRVAVVAAVAALSLLAILPTLRATARWGPRISWDDTERFPELGENGRYGEPERAPLGLTDEAANAALVALDPRRGGLLRRLGGVAGRDAARAIGAVLLLALAASRQRASSPGSGGTLIRLGALPAATVAGYALCLLAAPLLFLPQRTTEYAVPPLAFLALGAGPFLGTARRSSERAVAAGLVALCCWFALFGWGIDGTEGYTVHFKDRELYRALRRSTPASLVAGFPDGPIEQVPLFADRRAFYNRETHHVFHERYALEMRRRMTALSAALFGADPEALRRLANDFGVDLLVVDRSHFRRPPAYFAPFDAIVARDWNRGADGGFALEAALADAEIARDGRFSIVDLHRLGAFALDPARPVDRAAETTTP